MSKLPVILGVLLLLMLGTCSNASVVKRFLPGYPSRGYRPTFPWENFFKKSNDISSSESGDDDNSSDTSVDTDGIEDEKLRYDPDDLYDNVFGHDSRDEPNFDDSHDDVDSDKNSEYTIDESDIDDSGIDDSDIDDSDIDDSDIDDSDIDASDYNDNKIDTHDYNDEDIDYSDIDTYDVDDDGDDRDKDPLSDHLSDLPIDDKYFNEKQVLGQSEEDLAETPRREPRSSRSQLIKQGLRRGPAAIKGIKARNFILAGAIPVLNHGITRNYEKAGGQAAMKRDFYGVLPTKISNVVIDGHIVGKRGVAGNMRIRYQLYDPMHQERKPVMYIQEMDKSGMIVGRDIIHYMG